jgi:hypothetical protein
MGEGDDDEWADAGGRSDQPGRWLFLVTLITVAAVASGFALGSVAYWMARYITP